MSKHGAILLNSMDYSSNIVVGVWDGSTPGIIKALNPHRHDHYTCMLVGSGTLEVMFDFEHLTMPAGTLFVCPPNQVHQIIKVVGAAGYYISFEGRHLTESAKTALESSLADTWIVPLSGIEYGWFKSTLDSMIILKGLNGGSRMEVEQPLLSAFIAQAALSFESSMLDDSSKAGTRAISIAKKFRNLVKADFRTLKRPSEYAEKLNISVAHLNDVVKRVTGHSVSQLIQKELLNEAQRLLYYSEMTVKEISYQLGYQDPKYFIRLFTKKAGRSPGDYRKTYRPQPNQP